MARRRRRPTEPAGQTPWALGDAPDGVGPTDARPPLQGVRRSDAARAADTSDLAGGGGVVDDRSDATNPRGGSHRAPILQQGESHARKGDHLGESPRLGGERHLVGSHRTRGARRRRHKKTTQRVVACTSEEEAGRPTKALEGKSRCVRWRGRPARFF